MRAVHCLTRQRGDGKLRRLLHRRHAAFDAVDGSGRDFSAWIGLVPKQHPSGGRGKLGNISERGDRYLRSLFTTGALAVIRCAKIHGTQHRPWPDAVESRAVTAVVLRPGSLTRSA
jgi:transposase